MSLREEQCNKVCRILDDVLANRPTERDSLIVAVRKAFAEPQERKTGRWELAEDGWYCSACELYPPFDCDPEEKGIPYCPYCGAKMKPKQTLSEVDNDTAYGGLMSAT